MSVKYIQELVSIPSPSGHTRKIIQYLAEKLTALPYHKEITNKGALLVSTTKRPVLLITAHIDTLGGMVKSINADGSLEITQIGDWPPNSFEGEYVTILTQTDCEFRGTFMLKNPAAHVNRKISETERVMENMQIRLDATIVSGDDTRKLGISIGDFVFFDPRFEFTETRFVKSRFLDDKACAGILYDLLLNESEILKKTDAAFFFSNFEEVGHGVPASIPPSIKEVLVADMGVVGDTVAGSEMAVSICAKDSSGPYDYEIRRELIRIAQENNIPYVVDVFPYYSSDGSAMLQAGMDVRVGLIGPGVNGSHGVERTHETGILATRQLLLTYLKNINMERFDA